MLRNSIRNGCKNLYFALKKYLQTKFISDVNFPTWLGKSVNPNFWQYQPNRNNDKFTCSLEIQSNITEIITICTLNPLKVPSNQIHIWYQFPVNVKLPWPSKSVHPHFSQYQSILQKQWQIQLLFQKSLKNGCNNLCFHPCMYTFDMG